MKFSLQIICLICINSCFGVPFFSFFGSSPAPEKKTVDDLGFEKFDEFESEDILQDEPTEIHQKTDPHAESTSSVLSQLKSMLQSSPDSTKRYVAKKAEELTYLLKNDIRNVVEFTVNKNQMLVDLGSKNSRIRAVNVQEAKGLLNYVAELFSQIYSWVRSWFGDDEKKKLAENKDKERKNELKLDFNDVNSDHEDDFSTQTGAPKLEDLYDYEKAKDHSKGIDGAEKIKNSLNSHRETEFDEDDEQTKAKDQHKEHAKSKEVAKPSKTITDFQPFKNLSPEDKNKIKKDVDVAKQEIVNLEKTIQEIEKKPYVADDDVEYIEDLEHIEFLNDRIDLMEEFIKISTS